MWYVHGSYSLLLSLSLTHTHTHNTHTQHAQGSVLTLMSVVVLCTLVPVLFQAMIDGSKVPVWAYAGC